MMHQGRKISITRTLITGAGAAGMLAAYSASLCGNEVIIIEKNPFPGKKLRITGKGRCNITNNSDIQNILNNVTGNAKFLYPSLMSFSAPQIIDFFHSIGLMTKTERGGRVFPLSDSAHDATDAIYNELKKRGVKFCFNKTVNSLIIENNTAKGIITKDKTQYMADRVILCTGGATYPSTGSDGEGYKLAAQAGHTIIDLKPGLVPLEIKEDWISSLMGLSLRNVNLRAIAGDKLIFNEIGEMLFTHFGISGPLVLSLSSDLPNKPDDEEVYLYIDLKPALDSDTLDRRIIRDFEKNKNRIFANSLDALLPKKMIPVILSLSGIDKEKQVNTITKDERRIVLDLLKNFRMTYKKARPLEEAIITKGGICLSEVNPRTLESKLVKNLYFAGEILDLDARTGGYNLTIAFSTGYKAGMMS